MKYYFEESTEDQFIGSLYEFTKNGKKLIKKPYKLSKLSDIKIVLGVMCQKIAEGASLINICSVGEPYPRKFEFYYWVNSDPQVKVWFNQAKIQRNHIVIEQFYKQIENSKELSESSVKSVLEVLRKISTELKRDDDDTGVKTIVNTYLWDEGTIGEHFEDN